jgi:hypothetical protein
MLMLIFSEVVNLQKLKFLDQQLLVCFLFEAVVIIIAERGGLASLTGECDERAFMYPVVSELA